ncbi:MAG: FAD-binding oxidoreductase [Deltaproteobacteria bacterium]|nr:FAD-binding oxidoreductase [Deltaproteobacteria bacterium]
MSNDSNFQPDWRNDVAAEGSYRSIFKYDPTKFRHPSPAWYQMFKQEFGLSDEYFKTRQPGGDEQVAIRRGIALSDGQIRAFTDIVGKENVATDDFSRVKYSHGKSLDEDVNLRRGVVEKVPDLVVHPRDKEEVRRIVEYCNAEKIPLVTYGGGSGVVFGTRPEKGGVALVMRTHMNKVLALSELNQTATVQPGMLGPDFEAALNAAPERFGTRLRYTCGHFPQSFELASVGGWVLALGSGQASTYYGDAYHIVMSQEYVTPAGIIKTHDIPGTATGPKVNDIMKGSEGAYGVLVEVTMRIFRYVPGSRQRFSYMFPSWEAAVEASREIAQGEFGLPAVFRISDPEETEIGLKLKGFNDGLFGRYMKMRGMEPMKRCLCIGTVEGEKGFARHVSRQVAGIARARGAVSLTGYGTKEWEKGRYSDIHVREDLLDYGILVDTLESGVSWENVHRLHQGVRAFVKSRPRTFCLTHASHFYPQGTNLYFIFMMKPDSPEEFFEFRGDVVAKILEHGGSISHHHGIGRMFARFMEPHLGKEQMGVLRAIKRHLDPNGIMNPGGLLGLD